MCIDEEEQNYHPNICVFGRMIILGWLFLINTGLRRIL